MEAFKLKSAKAFNTFRIVVLTYLYTAVAVIFSIGVATLMHYRFVIEPIIISPLVQ